jgi:CrcB protein
LIIKLLVVGTGGFAGAIARYVISGLTHRILDGRFPYGTLAVNIIGCFVIGLVMYLVQERGLFPPNVRLFVTIGLVGAFTTYSTFAYESVEMLLDQRYLAAITNVLAHLIIGIGAVWVAMLLGQVITK